MPLSECGEGETMYAQREHGDGKLCAPCQAAYDTQPLGVQVRRWSADAADVNGKQAGLLCERCKQILRARNTAAAFGTQWFHFANPGAAHRAHDLRAQAHHTGMAAAFARMSADEQAARRDSHEQEVSVRLRWCMDHGLVPAHENIHLAPGSNEKFMVRDSIFEC